MLDLPNCGVGTAAPIPVVMGRGCEQLDLRLTGPDFDRHGWFRDLTAYGTAYVVTVNDPPVVRCLQRLAPGIWTARCSRS